MNQSEHTYYYSDDARMQTIDLQTLVAARLEDMAEQCEHLFEQGDIETAHLLREEGLELAEAYDGGYTFMFLNDLTEFGYPNT